MTIGEALDGLLHITIYVPLYSDEYWIEAHGYDAELNCIELGLAVTSSKYEARAYVRKFIEKHSAKYPKEHIDDCCHIFE